MEPTLLRQDYLITLNEDTYRRGDVVVLDDPEEPGAYIVKRVVGIGGDTVAVGGGFLYVDGKPMAEPYVLEPPRYFMRPVRVPPGFVLLLGDNRNNSNDSHIWDNKTQPLSAIVGRVRFIYYPYNRAGSLDRIALP